MCTVTSIPWPRSRAAARIRSSCPLHGFSRPQVKRRALPLPSHGAYRFDALEETEIGPHRRNGDDGGERAGQFGVHFVEQSPRDHEGERGMPPFLFLVRAVIAQRPVQRETVRPIGEQMREEGQIGGAGARVRVQVRQSLATQRRREHAGKRNQAASAESGPTGSRRRSRPREGARHQRRGPARSNSHTPRRNSFGCGGKRYVVSAIAFADQA